MFNVLHRAEKPKFYKNSFSRFLGFNPNTKV